MDRPLTSSEKESHAKNSPRRRKEEGFRISLTFIATLALFLVFVVVHTFISNHNTSIQHLSRNESRGFAPDARKFNDAIIQVYAARTRGVKGNFAVHTWLAYKTYASKSYEVAQVIGWRQQGNGNVVFIENAIADKSWWGNEPMLLLDIRGNKARELIPKIRQAIDSYPWSNEYTVYPGPNSNTFVSWVGQQVPELHLDLPATAIGKDWRPINQSFRASPSGTGITASFLGLLGIQFGVAEGLEFNFLGLHVEVDPIDLKVGLPLMGTTSIWWPLLFLTLRYFLMTVLRSYNKTYLTI